MNPVSTLKAGAEQAQNDEEALARQVADIIGPNSAAALALAELKRRRDAGEAVQIFSHQKSWFVRPVTAGMTC